MFKKTVAELRQNCAKLIALTTNLEKQESSKLKKIKKFLQKCL